MNQALPTLTLKDFASDQEVRWCPGCGDYAILKTIQKVMPELNRPKENQVFVSFEFFEPSVCMFFFLFSEPAVCILLRFSNPCFVSC